MMKILMKNERLLCQGCLGTQKLYDMWRYKLIEPYQNLIGTQMTPGCSAHLCHICAALVLKYAAFRNRCIESKELLESAIVMPEGTHPYKISVTYTTDYPDTVPGILEVMLDFKSDLDVSVKIEPETDILPHEIKVENMEIVVPQKIKLKKVKKAKDRLGKGSKSEDIKRNLPKFKQKGRYFETKENMMNFQRLFGCDIKVLSPEEQIEDVKARRDVINYPFKCNYCYKGFMDESNLTKHNKAWHDLSRGDAVCEVCSIRYRHKRDLNRHRKSHRLKFTCRQCGHVCKNTSNAMDHFKTHSGHFYICNHCGKTYEKQSTYLTHVRVAHAAALVWCELCGEACVSRLGLHGHRRQAHGQIEYPPNSFCEACNTQFLTAEALERHTHGCQSLSNCVQCGQGFTTRLLLKDHLLSHKPGAVVGHYPCVKCNKSFPRQNLYSAHYRRVHAEKRTKQIMCELCGKEFQNNCELRYHQRTHTGEKPFVCPHCPKSFIKRALMKSHMRVHSADRPFACKLCPKTFKGPAALSGHQHVLSYDGLPQHLCPVCSTMLLKFREFQNQCQNAQFLLEHIKKTGNMITFNSVSGMELRKRYFKSEINLTEYPEPNTDIQTNRNNLYIYNDTIKNESIDNLSIKVDSNSTESYTQLDIDENETNSDNIEAENKELTDIKEIDILANEKLNKNKNMVLNKNDCNMKFKRAAKINKIKGKYFETKENMADFECMYDVEIVILSKEQQMSDIRDRQGSQNYLNSPFKCQHCYKGFIDGDNLDKHFKSQHDPSRGSVVCEFCKFTYKDKRGLNQHLKSHRLKFICRQCKYVSRTTYNAKEHYKMHRGQMHQCKDCGKSYEKLSTYLTHLRIHHTKELQWCDLCGEAFVGDFGLNGHKKRAHRDLKFPPDCACACGALFTNSSALHHHASSRGCGQTPCSLCGASFDTRLMLKNHLLENHRVVKKYHTCSKCSKTFRSESLYSAHYRRMHAEGAGSVSQPWVCEVCGKIMPNKCRLVYHQRVHTGEKPYQCPQCPKSFTMAKLLRSHSRVHTNDRPFACKFCPKTFKGPSALRGHEYMHTGGKVKNTRGKNGVTKDLS